MSRKKQPPEWVRHAVVNAEADVYQVNLSSLPVDKKRSTWEAIKQNSPGTGELLQSGEFNQFKSSIEEVFGAVDICVDLGVVKGRSQSVNGVGE